ncbi:MAG: hypothetical protein B7Z58_14855 [Acidiphilium sp. 37-64-53]|uniref:DUF1223 domain-containing protein n=1 Tax=Acidiphilium sp. 37-64-53 TaxID=1970299 RepID=UPI000BC90168|nr:DUF1223 domain-containing protein [Acidiphilium sp. 37-64-53]OYW00600.1 MAG: hypothetical protein B7Z58_14855 [Acidiphilium sp. 37-64-53]
MDQKLLDETRLQLVQPLTKPLRTAIATALIVASAAGGVAAAAARPVVVELFTSQACSDCPPAEALVQKLQAAHPRILVLAMHVTYFNGPGWSDPFSFPAATARQNWYARVMHSDQVFTPQAVIDGHASAVGSDRGQILQDIGAARSAAARPTVQVTITAGKDGWQIALSGKPSATPAKIELFRFDTVDRTAVRGGENGGRKLTEIHVVRAMTSLGEWTGQTVKQQIAPGVGQHIAVLVQRNDGTIIGAAGT